MTFLHFRYRQRLGLLAASALDPRETDFVQRHVEGCESCERELALLRRTAASLREDASVERPLPISSAALRTRVLARIRSAAPYEAAPQKALNLASALMAIGLVSVGLLGGVLLTRLSSPGAPETAAVSPRGAEGEKTSETAVNDQAFYDRLEKAQTRVNAARYLAEAQDVLIQVTAAADCPESPLDNVDVAHEAQTSRSLLKRRAALVSGSQETLVAARGVMEEVEGLLQEVADLPKCTRRADVDAIARRVDRRHLLMKIDLVAQELAAP